MGRINPCSHFARDILAALVHELKLRPGEFVYQRPLDIAFRFRGLSAEDLACGLEHARQQGWLIYDPDQSIYTLTKTGFVMV